MNLFFSHTEKVFVNDKKFIPRFGMYVSNFGTYVSLLGMYVPNFGTKLLPQRKNFYSTVLQLFKHYVSGMSQVYR